MKYTTLEQEFINSLIFRKQRLIGAEFELIVTTVDGKAPQFEAIEQLLIGMVKHGWKPIKDKESKALVGVAEPTSRFGFNTQITIDTGYPILELAISPRTNLHQVQKAYRFLIKQLLPLVKKQNLQLLSYGIQPIAEPSLKLLSPRPRYNFFVKRFGPTEANLTVIASTQSNINVTNPVELIDCLNVMLGSVPVQIALFANSPIWGGHIHPKYKEIRSIFWQGINEPWRVGMPYRPFKNLHDYLRTIWGLETFLVDRKGKRFEVQGNPPFHRYLQYGGTGIPVKGKKNIRLKPSRDDIAYHNGFIWWDSRIKTPEKTVYLENRAVPAQPPGEEMTVFAFHLGLIENVKKVKKLLDQFDWKDLQNAKFGALAKTLKVTIKDRPIVPLAKKMLELAQEGLKKRGYGEEVYLLHLWDRLKALESPGDRMIKLYRKQGIEGVIEASVLR